MTSSHNVVFLLDVASSVPKASLQLSILRILNFLGCRFGLAKVRWGFKFFDSLGAQRRTSQVGSFRELSSRSWEDFEELLEARFGSQAHSSRLPGPTSRAALTRNILKETLLDYQWDRPEIASPAKPVLRSQKNKLTLSLDNANSDSSKDFENVIFLFSSCPHSKRELLQFVSGSNIHLSDELPTPYDLSEKFIPKGIQDMMAALKIALFWADTAEWSKVLESSDYVGYRMLVELLHPLRGTILPSKTLTPCLSYQQRDITPGVPEEPRFSDLPFTSWTATFPFDSTLNCLFSLPSTLQATFPQLEGMLILKTDVVEELWSCPVTLEPLVIGQRQFEGPVNIFLKYTMTGWNKMHAGNFHTEQWVLQSSLETSWFQQVVKHILAQGLQMVAEVVPSGSCIPCTGFFSPISNTAAVLSILSYETSAETDRHLNHSAVAGTVSKNEDFSLPEIINSVLNHADDPKDDSAPSAQTSSPEWAQQELHRTPHWSPAVVEGWYLLSNFCGASSHLMESFRLLQAASVTANKTPNPEMDLTHCLSEFYQRKASKAPTSSQRDHKKHGVPQTPVRQKMKTMPRSLQMLNVARLNVKAQKFQPDGEPHVSNRIRHRLLSRRSNGKTEEKGRKVKTRIVADGFACFQGFKTEEEMLSYLTAEYQKAIADEDNLFACVQDMMMAVSSFPKSSDSKPREMACVDIIRRSLLKSSKSLRQPLGGSPEKENQVKECKLQVYLRLEMSLQCPSLQDGEDEMEQLVEEMTEMLRMLCLTKDPAYLTKFLEEVVERYMESIPKILGDLYYSLGTQIPPQLASLLPANVFSDDSLNPGSQTMSLPASTSCLPASTSRAASLSTEADQLEELRTRSAKKRRNALARHRSMTEASQNLRQIEIPQGSKCRPRKDSSKGYLDAKPLPTAQKEAVQEVTKVRRNLFNGEMLPAGTGSLKKIPRSQSVSVLEGLKHKRSRSHDGKRDKNKLLTKRVAETPLHKQVSGRLLRKQINGRCSDPGSEVCVVEESPEKTITCGLRRSPRIKQLFLDRTLSGSFQSSQLKNMYTCSPRAEKPGDSADSALPNVKRAIQSPKSLLFGAVLEASTLERMDSPKAGRKSLASDEQPGYQTPRKTPLRCSQRLLSPPNNMPRRSPRLQEKLQPIPPIPVPKQAAAKNLGKLFSPCKQKSKSLPESREKGGDMLALSTPTKERFSSPSKQKQLLTPGKRVREEILDDVFESPPSNSIPAAASLVSAPFLCNSWGKSLPELQQPTLRFAERAAERLSAPELHSPSRLDSVLSEITPTKSRGAPSELQSSPHHAKLLDTSPLKIHSTLLPAVISPPSLTHSPMRTRKLSRMSHTPRKCSSKPPSITYISPRKDSESVPCLSEHNSSGSVCLSTEAKHSGKAGTAEDMPLILRHEQEAEAMSPNKSLETHLTSEVSVHVSSAVVVCTRLNSSYVAGAAGYKPLADSSLVKLNSETSQSQVLLADKPADLQEPNFLSPRRRNLLSLSATPKSSCCAYTLRCTPDRRQREAAARLGNPETAVFSAPSTCILPSATSPPTYAVELEMQASGLPKLRFKKVASGSASKQYSPVEAGKPPREENDLSSGDLSVTWCSRHPGKSESACISPSCLRSAHSTPGKLCGGQTYICQSYTPTRCPSNTTSPSHGNAAVPWTPPKQKGKVTPEAIKDWPRRKRATVGYNKNEKHMDVPDFPSIDKTVLLGEFELEGVYKLQSPCSDTESSGDDIIYRGTTGLKSRKRALEQSLSPEEEAMWEVKKPCLKQELDVPELLSTGKEVVAPSRIILEDSNILSISGSTLTPPRSSSKNPISASGLWALTKSPLLYQGHGTAIRKRPTDDNPMVGAASEDLSPFHNTASRRRPLSRTYSRKRLLS